MSSSQQAINTLLAEPWELLHKQLINEFKKQLGQPLWDTSTGTKEVSIGSAKLFKYSLQMGLHSAITSTTSLESPPGYEVLSEESSVRRCVLLLAVPLQGNWVVGLDTMFDGKFSVWADPLGRKVVYLDQSFDVPQRIEISNFRITSELELGWDPDEPFIRRLQKVTIKPNLQVRFSGLVNMSFAIDDFSLIADSDGYRLEKELISIGAYIPNIGNGQLDAKLIIILFPHITIKIEGELKSNLPQVGSVGLNFNPTIPTNIRLPESLSRLFPLVKDLPRLWGENHPQATSLPTEGVNFPAQAIDIEDAILHHMVISELTHKQYGIVYEINYGVVPVRGTVSVPPACRSVVTYTGEYDTAIWTGHYLAAEAFRYGAAKTDDERNAALDRVKLVLEGIKKLFEVTGVPGLFARAALPDSSKIQTDPSMIPTTPRPHAQAENYYGSISLDGESWHGLGRGNQPTSRDSYTGVMMGLAYAFKLIPEQEQDIKTTIKDLLDKALEFLILKYNWNVPTPSSDGWDVDENVPGSANPYLAEIKTTLIHDFDMQLAFLLIGKMIDPLKYGQKYEQLASDFAWIPMWASTLDPISSYYKFNLSHGIMGIILFLEDDPDLRLSYMKEFNILRRATRHHGNAYFNLVRILVENPNDRPSAMNELGWSISQLSLVKETLALLKEWLVRRDSVRGPNGLPTEKNPDEDYIRNLFPRDVAVYTPVLSISGTAGADIAMTSTSIQCKYALPVDKRPGEGVDFIWQIEPFYTAIETRPILFSRPGLIQVRPGNNRYEAPGIDYPLPIWMASYLGIITGS